LASRWRARAARAARGRTRRARRGPEEARSSAAGRTLRDPSADAWTRRPRRGAPRTGRGLREARKCRPPGCRPGRRAATGLRSAAARPAAPRPSSTQTASCSRAPAPTARRCTSCPPSLRSRQATSTGAASRSAASRRGRSSSMDLLSSACEDSRTRAWSALSLALEWAVTASRIAWSTASQTSWPSAAGSPDCGSRGPPLQQDAAQGGELRRARPRARSPRRAAPSPPRRGLVPGRGRPVASSEPVHGLDDGLTTAGSRSPGTGPGGRAPAGRLDTAASHEGGSRLAARRRKAPSDSGAACDVGSSPPEVRVGGGRGRAPAAPGGQRARGRRRHGGASESCPRWRPAPG
jgi:hypothetical protein